jgi:hypothetical protein
MPEAFGIFIYLLSSFRYKFKSIKAKFVCFALNALSKFTVSFYASNNRVNLVEMDV